MAEPTPEPDSIYPDVEEPVPAVESFARIGERAAQSQAAVLLSIGGMLGAPLPESAAKASAVEEPSEPSIPPEDAQPLGLTDRFFELERRRGVRRTDSSLQARYGAATADSLAAARKSDPGAVSVLTEIAQSLAEGACDRGDADAAGALVEASLSHPQPLVRTAAASAALEIGVAAEDRGLALSELEDGARSDDPLISNVARVALARIAPSHPLLEKLTAEGETTGEDAPARTALLVHGTFARHNRWWQPGGGFHTYLLNNVRSDLYSAADRFDWSGGYSDRARSAAAKKLNRWVSDRREEGLDLFCHSHGGSVAMEANQAGLPIGKLVLLSCPVHRGKYDPNFALIAECVVSIRVRLDLVILADGGRQRFRDPRIRENRLPLWFKHSASHRERVWQRHNVPALLGC